MTEIIEYSATEAALGELAARYKGVVYDVKTGAGMNAAVAARKELRDIRLKLEETRKVLKEPALRRSQLIDSEARRISSAISALEDPIDEQIKAETLREKREAEARAKAEAERLAAEEAARKAAEEERLRIEREKLDAERRAFEEEQKKVRAAEEARLAEERKRIAEERARVEAEIAERRRREDEERRAREAAEAKLREEREAVEREKRRLADEAQAKAKAEREEREAEENEKMAGKAMLKTFVQRFGHRKMFEAVVKVIKKEGFA
jgi:hypothetical protein